MERNNAGMAAVRERVEYSNLDLRMGVQRNDLLIAGDFVRIVDQHAHAHVAVGRAQHRVGQQLAGLVRAKNEVLKIEGALGGIGHLHPGQEPVDACRQHAKPGIPAIGPDCALQTVGRVWSPQDERGPRRRSWESRNPAAATHIRPGAQRSRTTHAGRKTIIGRFHGFGLIRLRVGTCGSVRSDAGFCRDYPQLRGALSALAHIRRRIPVCTGLEAQGHR